MAVFLAKRIIGGYLIFDQVPDALKEAVAESLGAMGRGDLAVEDETK